MIHKQEAKTHCAHAKMFPISANLVHFEHCKGGKRLGVYCWAPPSPVNMYTLKNINKDFPSVATVSVLSATSLDQIKLIINAVAW